MADTSNESTSDSSQSTEQERPKLPPIDFSAFIAELGMTAVTYLGGYQNPETKEVLVDLEMAKRTIDTIDLLKEKTKGNLTAPESNLLDNTLYNLRMTYIRIANNPPPPPTPETSESGSEVPSEQVGKFIDDAELTETDAELIGLIAPHAGYVYSGHVAGYAYKQLMGQSFDTVVLLGLSHRYRIDGAAIYARGAFRTPLGDIPIDEDLASEMMRLNGDLLDLPLAHAEEHSLEVQLPFLQHLLSDFRIVPILLQDDSPENVIPLGQAIAEAMGDRSCLLVGSTDLCHYPTYEAARQSDRVVIEAIEGFDPDYLREQMDGYMQIHPTQNFHCMMCSTGAIYTTMRVAKALGGNRIEVLKAANSGDVPIGGRDQVVGYMAAGIYR